MREIGIATVCGVIGGAGWWAYSSTWHKSWETVQKVGAPLRAPPRARTLPPLSCPAETHPLLRPSLQKYDANKVEKRKKFESWLATQPYDDEE